MAVTEFNWGLYPETEAFVEGLVAQAVARSPQLAELERRLADVTSTRLMNWLDYIAAPVSTKELMAAGYEDGFQTQKGVWRHPGAQLPAIAPETTFVVALRVDDCAAFAHAQLALRPIEGSPLAGFRRVVITDGDDVAIAGVERRSWSCGINPQHLSDGETIASVKAWRLWDERPRARVSGPGAGEDATREVITVAEEMVNLVGPDLAASYALELERVYWQRRNTAGMVQFARQDRLGLGWGNNDHHTFRSSRAAFQALIQMFNTLGFVNRERFYAGDQAGWGAQVLEHPGCGGVLFTDVDLEPDEVDVDFSSVQLPEASHLGTIGVWCALHGESILDAGMHHLEGQFEFDALKKDLSARGVGQMKPFSTFPHLRQAFTEAERWPVTQQQIDALLVAGHIDQAKAEEFASKGAAGSHLENLQRRAGFKGFNQHSVSDTMKATDPRTYQPKTEAQN